MDIPKIVPDTFKSDKPMGNLAYGEKVKGKVLVEFGGAKFEVDAEFVAGLEMIYALGFVSGTKTGKYTYAVAVTYRIKEGEHNCRIGGGLKASFIRFEPKVEAN